MSNIGWANINKVNKTVEQTFGGVNFNLTCLILEKTYQIQSKYILMHFTNFIAYLKIKKFKNVKLPI